MKKIKNYFIFQASRPNSDLAFDFFIVGGFFYCIYIGFIH